jgi:hypothetical protein
MIRDIVTLPIFHGNIATRFREGMEFHLIGIYRFNSRPYLKNIDAVLQQGRKCPELDIRVETRGAAGYLHNVYSRWIICYTLIGP